MGAVKKTLDWYKATSANVHNNKYCYDQWLVLDKYHSKIPIECPDHGIFYQALSNHITNKAGCPECRAVARQSGFNKRSWDEWVILANATHDSLYEYTKPDVFNNADIDIVDITCITHGVFQQRLSDHVHKKAGCPQCAKLTTRNTNLSRYGVPHPSQQHISETTRSLLTDREWLMNQHLKLLKPLDAIAAELGVQDTTVGRYFRQYNIPTKRFCVSSGERAVAEFIQNTLGVAVQQSDRTLIPPYELDIVLPDYNLAVEYCGLYWHSDAHKSPHYHANKTTMCNNVGVRLLTIYEDEWQTKQHIVKTKLRYLTKQSNNRVFARVCSVVLVSHAEKTQFFDLYHIQGSGPSSINIGLRDGAGELVACMGLIAKTNKCFILNRYATSTVVPGGFQKLLTYFKHNWDWVTVDTFTDLRWSSGELYELSGFTKQYTIPPDYCWTNGSVRYHKFGFRHKLLAKKLTVYDPNSTESQNCYNNQLWKLYDCGKIKYTLTRE